MITTISTINNKYTSSFFLGIFPITFPEKSYNRQMDYNSTQIETNIEVKNKNISLYELAIDLFGEMRNMNDEEKEWREKILDSVSTDIGISVYDFM